MSEKRSKFFCVAVIASLFILPLVGRVVIAGNGLPPDFLAMPYPKGPTKPGFNLLVFIAILLPCLVATAFFFFPTWFGFTQAPQKKLSPPHKTHSGFPVWFWPGVGVTLLCWIVMWGQFPWLGNLVYFTFVPMAWGVILIVDGWVYQRTGGNSLLAKRPRILVAVAIASVPGWYLFQYLNYFLLKNWYYPDMGLLSPFGYHFWHQLGNTTVITGVLEWYCLLGTFDRLKHRYMHGPKIDLTQFGVFFVIVGSLVTVLLGIWPIPLFWSVWLGPAFVLGGTLLMFRLWTPITPIKTGNWASFVLLGLGGLCCWLPWEIWNSPSQPLNPSFWTYDIPYFTWMPTLGEMPILGFFGYIPFGIHAMIWWLVWAHIFGISRYILPDLEQ